MTHGVDNSKHTGVAGIQENDVAPEDAGVEQSDPPDTKPKAGVPRRSFMKGLGAIPGGVAFFAASDWAHGRSLWHDNIASDLSEDKMVDMYTKMLKSRWWEEGIKDAFLAGEDNLYGAYHISIGQEAAAMGGIGPLNDDDYIVSNHRGHAHLICKGGDLNKMAAEIYFKQDGYCKGYGGSMHITDVSLGILGMNGIVGVSHQLAAGAGYGIKVRGTDQVAVAFGGDGSVQNGWFWGGLRNAAHYKLPVILFIENNGWQISNSVRNSINIEDLSNLGNGLNVPGYTVDGQDVLSVYGVMKDAVARARAGEGPTVIEAKTFRFYDHAGLAGAAIGQFGAFGLPYRSDADVRAQIANDPIARFRNQLVALDVLDEQRADEIEANVKGQVEDAIEFARNSPLPEPDVGLEHVYAEGRVAATQFFA